MVTAIQTLVIDHLQRKHLSPPLDWLVECLSFIQSQPEYQSVPAQQLAHLVEEQLLLADFRELQRQCLPPNLNQQRCTQLNGIYVLQVEEMRDVGRPAYGQLQKLRQQDTANAGVSCDEKIAAAWEPKEGRILQLTMTDGTQSVKGMEYKPIPTLTVNLPPGFKLQIKGPVECRKGMLLLQAHHLQILGGDVETLKVSNAAENVLARAVGWPENPSPCHSAKFLHPKMEAAVEQEVKQELPQSQPSAWRSSSAATNDFGTRPKSTHTGHLTTSVRTADQKSRVQAVLPSASTDHQDTQRDLDFMDSDDDVYFSAVDALEPNYQANGPDSLPATSFFMDQPVDRGVGIDKRTGSDVTGWRTTLTSAKIQLKSANARQNLPVSTGKAPLLTRPSSIRAYLTKPSTTEDTTLLFNSSHPQPQLSKPVVPGSSSTPMQSARLTEYQSKGLTSAHSSSLATSHRPFGQSDPVQDLGDFDCSLLLEDEDPFEEELQSLAKKPRTSTSDLDSKEYLRNGSHQSTVTPLMKSIRKADEQQTHRNGSGSSSSIKDVAETRTALINKMPFPFQLPTASEVISARLSVGPSNNRDTIATAPVITDTRQSLSLSSARLPFQYLKSLLRQTPFPGMQSCVKAIVTTLLSPLTVKDGQWQLFAKINDGSASLDVAFAHQIVEELVGFTPSQAKQLARSSDVANRKKVVEATTKASLKIMHLSCLMYLEWTSGGSAGSLLPVIKRMDDLTEPH